MIGKGLLYVEKNVANFQKNLPLRYWFILSGQTTR